MTNRDNEDIHGMRKVKKVEYIVSVEKQEDADEIERTYSCERLILCKDCMRYQPINEKSHLGDCPYRRDVIRDDSYCEKGEPKAGEQE